jgi:outer membrane protein OmpA-like peptidoglycan-associated protein
MTLKATTTAAFLMAAVASPSLAQFHMPRLPVLILHHQEAPGMPGQPPAPLASPGALQADLVVKSGSDTVYFPQHSASLDPNSAATLAAQARWLLANPFVNIRLEGHGGPMDSRDYALAIGERRADSVRDFLMLQGVAPSRISVISWGKERPGTVRIGTSVVAAGPRVVTRVQ